ncbi:MAG: pre-peptidase [Planctomycetota bacterium]
MPTQILGAPRSLASATSQRWLLISALLCALNGRALQAAPPKLTTLFPAGVSRGQTVNVTATGEFTQWPSKIWVDRPGITVTCEADKGKFKVVAAPDAPIGVYWLRLFDDEGATAPKPFIVGNLPEVEEVEPNESATKPQILKDSATINGKLAKAGDVDSFAMFLKAGQLLVASLDGHGRLGSPMDCVLQVARLSGPPEAGEAAKSVDPSARKIEAYVLEQVDDETGLDPRIALTAPREGWYLVRLFAFPSEPNSSIAYANAETYVYRLTLTTGPFVEYSWPLALSRSQPAELQLGGWNIVDGTLRLPAPPLPAEAAQAPVPASELPPITVAHEAVAGSLTIPWVDTPVLNAAAACSLTKPPPVPLGVTWTGRLATARDHDAFQLALKKGQRVTARAESRALGYGLDPYLVVVDGSGKVVAELDDSNNQRDVELTWAAAEDGDYRVVIRDVHGQGGPRYVYRLTIVEATPDFALTVAADSFAVTTAKPLEIPVTIDRRNGFNQVIDIRVEGLPPGVAVEAAKSEVKGDSAKTVKLMIKAEPAVVTAAVGQPIRIVGIVTQPNEQRRTAAYNLPLPATAIRALWLTARKE